MAVVLPARTWAEIDLDNIAHNYNEFVRLTGKRVMCVLKANGYGHGAVMLAKRLAKEGCDAFGVVTVDEGLELRRAGVSAFILLLSHIPFGRIREAVENDLTMTVFSKEMAFHVSNEYGTTKTTKSTKVHVKIDTGMTRLGFNPNEALDAVKYINSLRNIEIEGVFTHFASADEEDRAYTNMQIERFNSVVNELENNGFRARLKHAANSAAAIAFPEARYDMVRLGISLYGCYTSPAVNNGAVNLKPAMELKTQILRVNEVPTGVAVSYGGTFVTNRPSRLATIPIGYGDGISRTLSGRLRVFVNGQSAPVAGRICMDNSIVDITDISGDVKVLDEVIVFGAGNPVENVAGLMGTINYEVLCMVGRRVPRFYIENGETVHHINYLHSPPL